MIRYQRCRLTMSRPLGRSSMVLDATRQIDLLERLDQARVDASARIDPKQRAKLGQFFTPVVTARLMASMFTLAQPAIRLLDAGAGIGVLTAAFVAEVCCRESRPQHISVVAFELDAALGSRLEETVAACRTACEQAGIGFDAEIRQEDFIAAAATSLSGSLFGSPLPRFDCAILNPPYRKINTDSRERRLLRTVGIETSNLYTAFLALVAGVLDTGGELVAITPRSFCNGPYFRSFRRTFLKSMALRQIHVFDSRDDAFRDDAVLQETVIFRAIKNATPDVVTITSSTGPESGDERSRIVDYPQIVRPDDPDAFIRLVPDESGSEIAARMEGLPSCLDDLGLTVSTGRVVDFRATNYLRNEPGPDTVPLIYPSHFGEDGFIAWPKPRNRKPNALARTSASESLLVPAGTYVLVRRFSAKEERRRVVASIYDADRVSPLPVGFENHLNYYHQGGAGLPKAVARGLAAFLNSTQVDTYVRQFNGHTQVNATDLRSLRYPTLDELAGLGEHIGEDCLSQSDIDWLIEGMLFGRSIGCPTQIKSESA
jgi:adenine-specific DNA-methyltransferase